MAQFSLQSSSNYNHNINLWEFLRGFLPGNLTYTETTTPNKQLHVVFVISVQY